MFIHGFLLMERAQDVEVARQRARPVRGDRALRRRRAALLLLPRGLFGQDGSVSAAGFEARYETELANDYGNLASRTLAMIERYRDGVVPDAEPDPELRRRRRTGSRGSRARSRELLDRAELTQALEEIWARVRRLNRYVEETRPWDLAKERPGPEAGPAGAARRRPLQPGRGPAGARPCCSTPTCPRAGDRLLTALGEERRELAAFGSRGGGQRDRRSCRRCSRRSRPPRRSGWWHPPSPPATSSKRYGDTEALRGVSLEVGEGELVGPARARTGPASPP